MFREPFLPDTEEAREADESIPAAWREGDGPYTRYAATEPAVDRGEIEALWGALRPAKRGLVVAGRMASRKQGEAVARLADAVGWPLLSDIGSQVRLAAESETAAPYYDALLSGEAFADGHAPEAVIQVGGRPLSKRLERFLAHSRPDPYVVVRDNPFRLDPGHRATHSIEANIVDFCAALVEIAGDNHSADASWMVGWREASEEAGRRVDEMLSGDVALSEPLVARMVSRYVPEDHGLVLASSMPVRDADTFAAVDGPPVAVAANRGASGIDGTVATAAGFARGLERPVTLLIGDLALLHDLNSLALLRETPVTVVVLNNDGGGIFNFLPVSRRKAFFEPYFGTPQGVSFEAAAKMFGLGYEQPRTTGAFLDAYRVSCSVGESAIIEVRTDRDENVALHRSLLAEVTAGTLREQGSGT
jgi:2-succinyl-5-enolpyruvyl-6-hydroxy-3-cyclohexene-1-carboxylate synthase